MITFLLPKFFWMNCRCCILHSFFHDLKNEGRSSDDTWYLNIETRDGMEILSGDQSDPQVLGYGRCGGGIYPWCSPGSWSWSHPWSCRKYNNKETWLNGKYPVFDVNKDDVAKYSITGSPSLVINGEKVSTARDPASLLTTICTWFASQPEECLTELSSTVPTPNFGTGGNGAGSGTCGG